MASVERAPTRSGPASPPLQGTLAPVAQVCNFNSVKSLPSCKKTGLFKNFFTKPCFYQFCSILTFSMVMPSFVWSDSSPLISPPQKSPSGLILQWADPTPNRSFTVQTRDALNEGLWFAAPHSAPWPITTNQFLDTRTNVARRFFRVVAVPKADRGLLLSTSNLTNFTTQSLNSLFLSSAFLFFPLSFVCFSLFPLSFVCF